MKNYFLFLILIGTLFSCKPVEKVPISLTINNDKEVQVLNVPIVIKPESIKKLPRKFTISVNGKDVPYQIDDFDKDGQWDEIFLLADFKANESKTLTFSKADKKLTYSPKVAVTFAEKKAPNKACHDALRVKPSDTVKASDLFQMEGPAWENDIVGFRNYYDQRNANDIFGKQVAELSLAKAGINGQNYHELDTWGMDILKVGTSLGAGAIAIKKGDKIHRIANPEKSSFELIVNGPLRAIFNLKHADFKIDEHNYQINHQISIYAGVPFYESTVTVKGLQGDEELVTGIVNLHSDTLYTLKTDNQQLIFATLDKQAEMETYLGMAISLDEKDFVTQLELPKEGADITSSYAMVLKLTENNPVTFRFYALWENQNKKVVNKKYFLEYLLHPNVFNQ